jgi:hypothetical protein
MLEVYLVLFLDGILFNSCKVGVWTPDWRLTPLAFDATPPKDRQKGKKKEGDSLVESIALN